MLRRSRCEPANPAFAPCCSVAKVMLTRGEPVCRVRMELKPPLFSNSRCPSETTHEGSCVARGFCSCRRSSFCIPWVALALHLTSLYTLPRISLSTNEHRATLVSFVPVHCFSSGHNNEIIFFLGFASRTQFVVRCLSDSVRAVPLAPSGVLLAARSAGPTSPACSCPSPIAGTAQRLALSLLLCRLGVCSFPSSLHKKEF